MRKPISVSFEESQIRMIDMIISNKKFRNRSHFIEMAVDGLLQKELQEIRETEVITL